MISPKSVSAAVICALGLLLGPARSAAAQGATVTGIVTDEEGRPVPGASVIVVNTTIGVQSRDDGRYTLTRVPEGVKVLEARRIGFQPTRHENINIPSTGNVTVDFKLSVQTLRLQTVVTTGVTDPTSGVKLPVTVAKLSAEDLPVPTTASAASAIMGKVAGVRIVRGRGPGAGTTIQLRTPTSQLRDNSPMFIVDGIILSQAFSGTTADIDPADIESIEVIKGASAASLYGSKAAAGVVSIRTIRGNSTAMGSSSLRAREEYGFNTLGYSYQKSKKHYFKIDSEGRFLDATGQPTEDRSKWVIDQVGTDAGGIMDNPYPVIYDQDDQFFRFGQTFKSNASLNYNTQATTFSTAYNYTRDPGVIKHIDGTTQNQVRLNVDHRYRDFLNFSFNATHTRRSTEPNPGSIITDVSTFRPDVNLLADPLPGTGVPYLIVPDPADNNRTNPLYRTWKNDALNRSARTLISGTSGYQALSWLRFDGQVSYDRSDRLNENFTPRGMIDEDGVTRERGDYQKTDGATDNLSGQLNAIALNAWGDLTARTTVGAVIEKEVNSTTTANSNTFATSGVRELDAGVNFTSTSSYSDIRAVSTLINTGLDYAGKYIFDGVARYDGSSLFGYANRWNMFYRVSGAYRMAEEPWWPIAALTEFKIRYAIGTGGTRPNFLDQYETLTLQTGGGVVRRSSGNNDLVPETSREQDLTLEAIYKNRISLQLSAVKNNSFNNIIDAAAPGVTGFNTVFSNVGEMESHTFEATIQAQVVQRPTLTWEVNLVADQSSAKVVKLGRPEYGDGYTIRGDNRKISYIYGRRFVDRVADLPEAVQPFADQFQVNDDGLLVWVGAGNQFTEGVSKGLWGSSTTLAASTYQWGKPILYRNAAGVVADEEFLGDFAPKGNFGLGNTVRYKGVSFYALFTGVYGGKIYNAAKQTLYNTLRHPDVDQSGKAEGLKKPTTYYTALRDGGGIQKYFLEDGTWGKLTEVNIAYTIPERHLGLFSRVGIKGMRLEANGRNLMWWGKYSGLDPEVGGTFTREDAIQQPLYRNWTTVLNLTF